MDTMWSYRSAYIEASKIKQAQDEYCARAESGLWDSINTPYPENGQYEVLVDVLRGRVKVGHIKGCEIDSSLCSGIYPLL